MTETIQLGELTIHVWHKSLLHEVIPPLIQKWEPTLGVSVHCRQSTATAPQTQMPRSLKRQCCLIQQCFGLLA